MRGDPCEAVRHRARQGHGRVGEGRRRGEPVGGGDVEADEIGGRAAARSGPRPRSSPISPKVATNSDSHCAGPSRSFARHLDDRHREHRVRRPHAGDARRRSAPRRRAAPCAGAISRAQREEERHRRIEMRAARSARRCEISTTSAAPVASVFASSAMATFPPARRSPMMPEPTTAASRNAVPSASAASRRRVDAAHACAFSSARLADLVQPLLERHAVEAVAPADWRTARCAAAACRKASRNAAAISASSPSTAAGSGTPQCAVIGWPGQTGQTSFAALSQTVNTKSSGGAPGAANSSQLLERKPSVGKPSRSQQRERLRMHRALGLRARRIGDELALADLVQDRLGQDRARRIAGAEEQHVVGTIGLLAAHQQQLRLGRGRTARGCAGAASTAARLRRRSSLRRR